MKCKKISVFLGIILWSVSSYCQNFQAIATLDTNRILIGDHINVKLQVTAPTASQIHIPVLKQELLDTFKIDLIGCSKIDTAKNSSQWIYSQIITITSFDSGGYVFPAILIFGADSTIFVYTEPLAFFVGTIAVDTTAAIYDIKSLAKVPLTFREILPFILIALAITTAILIGFFIYVKYGKKKKKQAKEKRIIIPKEKAHLVALKELESLKNRKLWESGMVKLYYSELTDIVRCYLENRYEFGAPEMITDEIMEAIKALSIGQSYQEELHNLLTTADLVKFAKWTPLPDENDHFWHDAKRFVEHTADIEQTKA